VPVVPNRESLRISDRNIAVAASRTAAEPHFFSRRAPASAAQRESFANESARVQQAIGPFNQPAPGRAVENRGAVANGAANGPANGNAASFQGEARSPRPGNTSNTGTWRLFGPGAPEQAQPQSAAPPQVYSRRNPSRPQTNPQATIPQAPPPTSPQTMGPQGLAPASPQTMGQLGLPPASPQTMGPHGPPPASPQQMGPQGPPPASPQGLSGWQRFSGQPRPDNGFREAQPENRPQLQLNRPIVQPRSIPGNGNYQGYVPEPRRAPEPRNEPRTAPPPPPAPNSSAPTGPAPGGNNGGGPHNGFNGGGAGPRPSPGGGGGARPAGHGQGHR
jgi:translation initiation factor IF-2